MDGVTIVNTVQAFAAIVMVLLLDLYVMHFLLLVWLFLQFLLFII